MMKKLTLSELIAALDFQLFTMIFLAMVSIVTGKHDYFCETSPNWHRVGDNGKEQLSL